MTWSQHVCIPYRVGLGFQVALLRSPCRRDLLSRFGGEKMKLEFFFRRNRDLLSRRKCSRMPGRRKCSTPSSTPASIHVSAGKKIPPKRRFQKQWSRVKRGVKEAQWRVPQIIAADLDHESGQPQRICKRRRGSPTCTRWRSTGRNNYSALPPVEGNFADEGPTEVGN